MNKKQAEAAIKVIKCDATLSSEYINDEGSMCVIGGLAHAAGITNKHLIKCGCNTVLCNHPSIAKVVAAIQRKFGITRLEQQHLQRINDSILRVTMRRKKLIASVRIMVVK
jgi:hypothetical protein